MDKQVDGWMNEYKKTPKKEPNPNTEHKNKFGVENNYIPAFHEQ